MDITGGVGDGALLAPSSFLFVTSPLQGHSSRSGAKWVLQQCIKALALLFVLLLLGGSPDTGMCGAGAAEEQTVRPTPWEMAVRMALVDTCHVDAAGGGPTSPLLCEGRGLMSVCPLPPHKSLPRSFGGGRGPSCGQLQPGGPGWIGAISPGCSCSGCKGQQVKEYDKELVQRSWG